MELASSPVVKEEDIKIFRSEETLKDLIKPRRIRRGRTDNLYKPLASNHTEPEYQGTTLPISSAGTENDPNLAGKRVIPRGSALRTSSGNLATQGINHIIHAAPGSETQIAPWGNPTRQGVVRSVQNSILLAERLNYESLAIPFIGGNIFLTAIGGSKQELARNIIEAAINQRNNELTVQRMIFVPFEAEDKTIFQEVLADLRTRYPAERLNGVDIRRGDITQFTTHGCSAIVNAANMEVNFGGGVSGVIGHATGQAVNINNEA